MKEAFAISRLQKLAPTRKAAFQAEWNKGGKIREMIVKVESNERIDNQNYLLSDMLDAYNGAK